MSLDWNIGAIPNYKEVCFDGDRLSPVTNALIWNCMFIDMGSITQGNIDTYVWRTRLHETLFGNSLLDKNSVPYFITREDVEKHVGLTTNVSTKTDRQFWAKLAKRVEEDFAHKTPDVQQEIIRLGKLIPAKVAEPAV